MTFSYSTPDEVDNNINELSSLIGNTLDALNSAFIAVDEWVSEARDRFDGRSEAWQDSSNGRRVGEFLDGWEEYRNGLEAAQLALQDVEYTPAESTDYM